VANGMLAGLVAINLALRVRTPTGGVISAPSPGVLVVYSVFSLTS